MRRRTFLTGAAATAAVAGSGSLLSACGSSAGSGVPRLDFLSLAWQTESVKANKALVAQWNQRHPEVQVRYVQGSWDDVHDQLLTSFEGGAAPDIIHDEGIDLTDFGFGGYLADLTDLLPAGLKSRIPQATWDTARFNGGVYGVPFLQEPRVLIANRTLLVKAGVRLPDDTHPWTWQEFEDICRELSHHGGGSAERYGTAWPMSSPVSVTLNLSLTTGGRILYKDEGSGHTEVRFGTADSAFAEMVRRQVRTDRSAPSSALALGGGDVLPGFFAGRYAMLPLDFSYRQQIQQQAPKNFDWVTLPLPVGTHAPDGGRAQGVSPQTLSVAKSCKHQQAAVEFIDFMTQTPHLVQLAQGDWMPPTGTAALRDPSLTTTKLGWSTGMALASHLTASPALGSRGYPEWSDKIATPALQQYYSGAIGLDSLRGKLVRDGNRVFERYRE
ncbi:carbohydrate ABC transporter substrate-binding protein, CUT1 family [Actinacidiphila yanglinensis]|uniref:Carbohydrate ABC transporter substrate-binding protein, CUT1 family n=1 Tax=Actinacidiphila yanglinensis TaxID=310779 RepID=A0A1H6D520_9ACTN|nr:sugar ABC transporter substrate-binding protein [Actinacidiphila yanglinensis]SEG80351.1 carbohydrate ABC transporter substrate-binding protein, CUT1 family [Actinacidiphila yanglinensis]